MRKRTVIKTCSLCQNFDPNRRQCSLTMEFRDGFDTEFAAICAEKGDFIRDMNVIPDTYNYANGDEDSTTNWEYDMNRLPTDKNGLPLFVNTNRGLERAIPATSDIDLVCVDSLTGVKLITTYQGQREIIYELGVEIAKEIAVENGVELVVFPEEEGWEGVPEKVRKYKQKQGRHRLHQTQWISSKTAPKGW